LVLSSDFKITKVAVIDSGVNYNNPTLKRRMWTNPGEIQGDGVDNDQNGLIDDFVGYDFSNDDEHPMDDQGHGSHVSGLVAGEQTGVSAENVQIMAIKAGGARGPDIGSIISGILYAIENKADVINMSFGSTRATEAVKAAIKLAGDSGILVVAASGNGDNFGLGVDNDKTPHYPSSYDLSNILAVGSVRTDDALTRYSNYGFESVDVVTVGGFSDRISGPAGLLSSAYIANPSGILTQPLAGTSMASPVAAGVAALILSIAPDLSPSEVIELMMVTSRKVGILGAKVKSGAVLDAEAAVLSILNSRLN
jgi:subtilisin family serine protease